jgi:hypothetical protein
MTILAIVRKEFRETITFSDKATADTCKHLRGLGFDYDNRNGVWYRKAITSLSTDEPAITKAFAA